MRIRTRAVPAAGLAGAVLACSLAGASPSSPFAAAPHGFSVATTETSRLAPPPGRRTIDDPPTTARQPHRGTGTTLSFQQQNRLIGRYCLRCHNDAARTGGLSLETYDAARAGEQAMLTEKIIRKLQAGMMPPATALRPDEATYAALVDSLSKTVDDAAARNPDPGGRSFQRLNRAEYERSIYELLGLHVDAGAFLPPDTISAGFDNIADVQGLSATVMEGYLRAAGEIARLALGDAAAAPRETTYEVPRYASQTERVHGAPFGTRGGLSVVHVFPADGRYVFRLSFQHESTGNLFGNGRGALHTLDEPEKVEISIEGEPVALLEVDRWAHRQEPGSMEIRTEPIIVKAGPRRVSAAFLRRYEGPVEDIVSPHEWSLADKKIGYSYGVSTLPHLRDLVIGGPFEVTGVSDNIVRQRLLTCRPAAPPAEHACAAQIIDRLARRAYRRLVAADELATLLAFFDAGRREGGFDAGIRTALTAVLASPDFIFRFEEPAGAGPADSYRIGDTDLAARLSFFLWSRPPDEELLALAAADRLSDAAVLERQVRRMLADPRIEAMGSRFAAQWLRLQDLDLVHPDALRFPDYHQQLADSMRRETELLFEHLVREDGGFFELLDADYSYIDERLARHYGIDGVVGSRFRRVSLPPERRGILGHGSILTLTSHANRTSPVLRGKWVMEVLLGTPPPPPPPDVPDLEEPDAAADARVLSVRQQMEMHRASPACMSCHRVIDPLGLALENFDVTGAWRIKDRGVPVDPTGELYDGSLLDGPDGLRRALERYGDAVVTHFTASLMSYALGRRIEHTDMPAVRAIVRRAAANDYRLSSFLLGVVESPAFRYNRPPSSRQAAADGTGEQLNDAHR